MGSETSNDLVAKAVDWVSEVLALLPTHTSCDTKHKSLELSPSVS